MKVISQKVPRGTCSCKLRDLPAKVRLTMSQQYFENERLDYLRPHPETALPILKQSVK